VERQLRELSTAATTASVTRMLGLGVVCLAIVVVALFA
jgi:hypothetical protein